MISLDRSIIEKAGYDNGWEISSQEDSCVLLSSSRFEGNVKIDFNVKNKVWTLSISRNIDLEELKRDLPKEVFLEGSILCYSIGVLYAVLRRSSELALSLPRGPELEYKQQVDKYFGKNPEIMGSEK